MGREIIANQIFVDDPVEVWETARRLLEAGLGRERVFRQLALACALVMRDVLDREEPFDRQVYVNALRSLPVPDRDDIETAIIELVRAKQGIAVNELDRRVFERLNRDPAEELVAEIVDRVMDDLVTEFGPLEWLAGDRTVHVDDLTAGIVLTHRLSEAEREVGALNAAFDLAGFCRRDGLTLPDGAPLRVFSMERGHRGWWGPAGWLERFAVGVLLAVRVDAPGVVHLEELDDEPAVDAVVVARLRAAYDREVEEPWLPVSAEELVLNLLLEDRTTFGEPRAPLADLSEAAGLERRQDEVAHDDTVWHGQVRARRVGRVMDEVGDDRAATRKALRALDVADLVSGVDPAAVPDIGDEVDASILRSVLADLADEEVLSAVAVDLFDHDDAENGPRATAFIDALLDVAARPREIGVARFLAAVVAERSLEPRVAEQHLEVGHEADPSFGVVIDRLAWYASDRGDARRAASLWRSLERSSGIVTPDLGVVEPFASSPHPNLGRNELCWCGSGRKYKHCHLGSSELSPLPDRVGWIWGKAVSFMARRGGAAQTDVAELAYAVAPDADDERAVSAAFDDPIVIDLALTEGGWFERFLEERSPLLPDDEAMLAQSWLLVDRSVYEVVDVQSGRSLTLRDLRTGDQLVVRERTFSAETRSGALICARAVADGTVHQLVGGVFRVAPGRERDLLELLDERDPFAIAQYVSELSRPPVLQTREGEGLVECELVLEVGDPAAARAFLDEKYKVSPSDEGDRWIELHGLNQDEEIVRSHLRLDGARLSVSTNSNERADRVLGAITGRSIEPASSRTGDDRWTSNRSCGNRSWTPPARSPMTCSTSGAPR